MSGKRCPNCEAKLTGCSCQHKTASDGSKVHIWCLEQYENKLKNNKNASKLRHTNISK